MVENKETQRPSNGGGQERPPSPGVIGGAALVGATVGAIVSGPLLAIGLGACAAGLCLRNDEAGDAARSTGQAGLAVVEKGKEVNEHYHITEKVKEAAQTTYEKAKLVDEEHGVVEKTKAGALRAWWRIKEVDKEHRLVARAGQAFGDTMDGVTKALSGKDSPKSSGSAKK